MAQIVLPRVQAMVICDSIDESDDEIGIYHLSGVRSSLHVPVFPALCPRIGVFAQMSGHRGEAPCSVRIRQEVTDNAIYQTRPKAISFLDPTFVVPVVFRLRNCIFPAPGLYFIEILHEKKLIGERRFQLRHEE